jgi:hypothetical protein
MAEIRTKRRRVRQVHPTVLQAIHEALLTGASAPQVVRSLSELQMDGRLPAGAIPSERTVSNIAREMRGDDSAGWRLDDGEPETVALLLRVLGEVTRRSGGSVTSLTKAEAHLIPLIHRATAHRFRELPEASRDWQSYVWSRFYIAWVRSDDDARDVALLCATLQSDEAMPASIWLRHIERVNTAMDGWLPSEMREVNQ